MEKDRFNYLIHQFNSLTQEETAELRLEQDHFGYCQVLHQLIARGDQDNQTDMKDFSLNVAAVYSTDRSVLKRIMTEPRTMRAEWAPPSVAEIIPQALRTSNQPASEIKEDTIIETVTQIQKEEPKNTFSAPLVSDFDSDGAVARFIAELAPMREKKMLFERAVEEFEKNQSIPTLEKTKKKSKPSAATNTNEQLLEEIKTTKKKIVPESQKQKEQIEIIDEFIKSKPTISKPTGLQPETELPETPETYNENVVSETLAIILIQQGKKEKAIEVLRKLIWKFPQKKAYFAAQIEDLTKQ